MLNGPSTQKIYLYHYLTFGFYFFYWCAHSRGDINRSARQTLIPTTWLLALPFGNYWWMWRYGEGLEHVSYKRIKGVDTFLLYIIVAHAWLLLTFGFQPTIRIDSNSHFTSLAIILLVSYALLCILLQITGAAFFCATMQKKINALRSPAPVS